MISLGLIAEAWATSPSPIATLVVGRTQSTNTVLPTATESSFDESWKVVPPDGAGGAAWAYKPFPAKRTRQNALKYAIVTLAFALTALPREI
jgi:hypothetical protein